MTDERWTNGAATPAEADRRVPAGRVPASSELDRQENKDKTGVFTGAYAINPVNGAAIPVFLADYVLMGYGTGAIMAVPGQDQRDWDFADRVRPADHPHRAADRRTSTARRSPATGPAINSSVPGGLSLDGLDVAEAKKAIIGWLEEHGHGTGTVQYKLRDWLFARQRYWGEPFPIVYDEDGLPIAAARGPAADRAARGRRLHAADLRPGRRRTPSRRRRWPRRPSGSTSSWTWATARRSTAATRT